MAYYFRSFNCNNFNYLIIAAFFIGKYVSKQRKKRANELKDDDFEYVEDKFKETNENKLINE